MALMAKQKLRQLHPQFIRDSAAQKHHSNEWWEKKENPSCYFFKGLTESIGAKSLAAVIHSAQVGF